MSFFGRDTVLADLRLHRDQAGLVTAGTLNRNGTTPVSYANVCVWPATETSGLGADAAAIQHTTVTAWRIGESGRPQADDSWTVGGKTFNVQSVTGRHTADEANGYAIYDCQCDRKG